MDKFIISSFVLITLFCGCKQEEPINSSTNQIPHISNFVNTLDYTGAPKHPRDRDMLVFSDQGAWFGYGMPKNGKGGSFSGPFLMTQENGVWLSPNLVQLKLIWDDNDQVAMDWKSTLTSQHSFSSHLEQVFENSSLGVKQELVFMSGHTALQRTSITNRTTKAVTLNLEYSGVVFKLEMQLSSRNNTIQFNSKKSDAVGYLQFLDGVDGILLEDSLSYKARKSAVTIPPNSSREFLVSQSFIFPEYAWDTEKNAIHKMDFDSLLDAHQMEKDQELAAVQTKAAIKFRDSAYVELLAKAQLTLQNNWRIAAGELKHQGLFPSYHYEWFHGFWSWDSWKHAAGLSLYAPELAKDQMRAMFDFQLENGFIVDCVYRDTSIEPHNFRDTKPPLAAWAVAKITPMDSDTSFVKEMYPKLKKYHEWWYVDRDHDQDGLCEYGSTDGTLIAAKWESGMDNAIRFDNSKILKNSEGAYSLDQESVDLNAYLYAEKLYLGSLAQVLNLKDEAQQWKMEAENLKQRIQTQFYDEDDGWFYDTNLSGEEFVKGAGSEGWIPLWAKVATNQQAEAVKNQMLDPKKFYVKVPFQTMAADHPLFNPLNGYWRGPNWLDQAYFGIKGLRNYGFTKEADEVTEKLLHGAEGLMEKGEPIYENYHPLTGKGLYAKNFSWSAAHIILLLTNHE
ncbi:MGH1-like glycoside hydrolase domain-containing protein [Flagellimonas sp.]|uniref:MGH1-like glycoside hydrolase domain-containing protein n=1 Tax=Flagellimonas sp. TaxID=2058762 RepID=UPI003B51C5AB